MRKLVLFMAMICCAPFALSRQNSPPPPLKPAEKQFIINQLNALRPEPPLTEDELQTILGQLNETGVLRKLVADYDSRLKREQDLRVTDAQILQRTEEMGKRELAVCEKETRVREGERDLALEKAAFWEQAYKTVTKKPGIGCRIWQVLTLGLHACY